MGWELATRETLCLKAITSLYNCTLYHTIVCSLALHEYEQPMIISTHQCANLKKSTCILVLLYGISFALKP